MSPSIAQNPEWSHFPGLVALSTCLRVRTHVLWIWLLGERLGQQRHVGSPARGATALRMVLLWEIGDLLGEFPGERVRDSWEIPSSLL